MTLVWVQVLRGLAALAVATEHALNDAANLEARLGRVFRAPELFPWNAGVDVFFVISGLIMVHASRALFAAPGGPSEFLRRRIARVVPLYWIATTLYLLVALAAPRLVNRDYLDPGFVLASYLFLPVARPDGLVQPLYALGWTLNYEMAFYALFAAALVLPLRRAAILLLVLLAGLVLAGRALAPLPQPLAFWTDPIVLEFAAGVGLGVLRAEGLRAPGTVRLLLAAAGLGGLVWAGLDPGTALAWPRALAYGAPAALLVAAAALGPDETRPPGVLVRAGLALGDASYALYLVHPFAIRAARELFGWTGAAAGPAAFVLFALLATVGAALLTFRFVERPLTARVRAALGAERRRAAQAGRALPSAKP